MVWRKHLQRLKNGQGNVGGKTEQGSLSRAFRPVSCGTAQEPSTTPPLEPFHCRGAAFTEETDPQL